MNGDSSVTRILRQEGQDRQELFNRLFPLLYDELRREAHKRLQSTGANPTLDSVALVNEAYLKMIGLERIDYQNRIHFRAVAARAMQQIIYDYARMKRRQKRGGGVKPVRFDDLGFLKGEERPEAWVALEEALARLAEVDEEASRMLVYSYFAGLTLEEIATETGVSVSTVRRRLDTARAWLYRELGGPIQRPERGSTP